MVSEQAINDLRDRIVQDFGPERIILFGSYAYGAPSEDSDVDLLVVMAYTGTPLGKAVEIVQKLRAPFSVDLIVRSPAELRQRIAWNDRFIQDVLERGRELYATHHG